MNDKRDNDKGRPRKPGGGTAGRGFRKDGAGPFQPREEGRSRPPGEFRKPREDERGRFVRASDDRKPDGERKFQGERKFAQRS